jgi:hypothetical protein
MADGRQSASDKWLRVRRRQACHRPSRDDAKYLRQYTNEIARGPLQRRAFRRWRSGQIGLPALSLFVGLIRKNVSPACIVIQPGKLGMPLLLLRMLLFVACILVAAAGAEERRPNVTVILIDDPEPVDMTAYGATDLAMPNMDRFTRRGGSVSRISTQTRPFARKVVPRSSPADTHGI